MDTSGFYTTENGLLLQGGPNYVEGPGFKLDSTIPADRARELAGWKWFESLADAEAFHGLTAA